METFSMPQMLLIAGTGRHSGKTTLACQIIKKFSLVYPIIAVKVSPHFHTDWQSGKAILNEPDRYLAEETDNSGKKDSSLMLAAGAQKSFFLMATDDQLGSVIPTMLANAPKKAFWVCESGGLRHYITPGLFLIMNGADHKEYKSDNEVLGPLADRWISFDGKNIDFNINTIEIENNTWIIKNHKNVII